MGEWRSLGATKNAKFAKASNLRKTPLFDFDSRLRLQKTNQQAKPFAAVAQCTAKKEPGNPNQDLGKSSIARKERRRTAYATAYDACTEIANFKVKKRNTRVALRGLFHVACLLIMFLNGRLAMPCTDVRM